VKPAERRAVVQQVQERYGLSQRRACQLLGIGRSTARYRPKARAGEAALRQRLRDLAAERPRFGYRRLHALLRREGVIVNHKRIERLYRAEDLAVRRRTRKRMARDGRGRAALPERPNHQWAIDFVSDALAWGRRIRLFTVVDVFTREVLAIEVDTSLPGGRVVRVLERLALEYGAPHEIVLDNGPELAGKAVDHWAYARGVVLRFIEPGKPVQNAFIESFHGRLRDECLNRHWFIGLNDARRTIETWRQDYNRARPHSALGYRSPEEFRRFFEETAVMRQEWDGLSE
jgi:putative transposase